MSFLDLKELDPMNYYTLREHSIYYNHLMFKYFINRYGK